MCVWVCVFKEQKAFVIRPKNKHWILPQVLLIEKNNTFFLVQTL